jgi:hypothetical protein
MDIHVQGICRFNDRLSMWVLPFKRKPTVEFQHRSSKKYALMMHHFESNLNWDGCELENFGTVASLIEEGYHNPVRLPEFAGSFSALCTSISAHSISLCAQASSAIHGQLLPNIIQALGSDDTPKGLLSHVLCIAIALLRYSGDDSIRDLLIESEVSDHLFLYFTDDDPTLICGLALFFHDLLLHSPGFRRHFLDSGQFDRYIELFSGQTDPAIVAELSYLPALFANPVCTFSHLTTGETLEVLRAVLSTFQVCAKFGLSDSFVSLILSFLNHTNPAFLSELYFESDYIAALMDLLRFLIDNMSIDTLGDPDFVREFRLVATAVVKVIRQAPELFDISIVPLPLLPPLLSLFDHPKVCKRVWWIVTAAVECGGVQTVEQLDELGVFNMIVERICDFGFGLKAAVLEFCTRALYRSRDDEFLRLMNEFTLFDLVLSHLDTSDAAPVQSVSCVFDRIFMNKDWSEMIEAHRELLNELVEQCDASGLETMALHLAAIPRNEELELEIEQGDAFMEGDFADRSPGASDDEPNWGD